MAMNEIKDKSDPGIGESFGKMKAGASDLGTAVSMRRSEMSDRLGRFVQERPLVAVGAALGIGYVLGGGLFSRSTARLLSVGLRVGAAALAREMFSELQDSGKPF